MVPGGLLLHLLRIFAQILIEKTTAKQDYNTCSSEKRFISPGLHLSIES
jgi:hypothetical protein